MNGLLSSPLRNLLVGVTYLLVVCGTATLAYRLCGWPLGDAFFMVVTTVFTVGYGEIRPVDSSLLRSITIGLIVAGCTGMIFVTGALVQLITASQFQQILGVRRMQKDISALRGHVIICGFGRIGQMLAHELGDGGVDCVVLESNAGRVQLARELGHLAMEVDATQEDALVAAGIRHARALTSVVPDDAANVFITLSARGLNENLTIIARGEAVATEKKLLQAGANRVVLPARIGAERVAELILFQDIVPLLEGGAQAGLAGDLRRLGLDLEVVPAAEGSRAAGLTVGALEEAAAGAFLVVALNRAAGGSFLQPAAELIIQPGDGVAVVVRPGRTSAIQSLFSGQTAIGPGAS
jgi:voltage-gated potassium channel Kch